MRIRENFKKTAFFILLAVLTAALMMPAVVCAGEVSVPAKTGKVGVVIGSVFDPFCADAVPGGVPEYFYVAADMPSALEFGKIDAYIDDEQAAIAQCAQHPACRIDKVLFTDYYGFVFNKENEELCGKLNEYIAGLKESGELEELRKLWLESDDESLKYVDYEELSAENGTLNIIATATTMPMSYIKEGKYVGFEAAILAGFCKEYGYGMEFANADFASVLAAVTTGVADIGAASISITEERKQSLLFSEPYIETHAVSVVRREDADDALTAADFAQSRLGMLDGSIHISTAQKYFPQAVLHYFDTNYDIASALQSGRIDGYIVDEPVARSLISEYEDQKILNTLDDFSYAFALPKNDPGSEKLREQLDNFINKLRESGELREIDEIWFGKDEALKTVDLESLKANSKMITFAVFAESNEPFIYKKDGKYVGYEVDIMARFCNEYGYDLDINEYTFDGIMNALENGKCDVAAGAIAVTEEREEHLLFASHYEAGSVLVIKGTDTSAIESGFWAKIKNSFHKTFISESRWKLFLSGMLTTNIIAIMSVLFGTLTAFVLYLLYNKKSRAINSTINACCFAVERTPAVVILMIMYYLVFGRLDINAAVVAVIGLCMKFAVQIFGLFKIGAGAVGSGQTEAALALGYSEKRAFTKIIFPQAVLHIVSGYKSSVVSLIEESAVVGYIAVQDLTKVSDIIRSRTYEAFFPLISSALIYVAIAVIMIAIVKVIASRMDPKRRSEDEILKGIER